MKKFLHNFRLRATRTTPLFIVLFSVQVSLYGQCLSGSSIANTNWDNLDYLVTTGSYSGFVTTAMSRTQAFAIGVNRVVVAYPGTMATVGENTGHTGEAGSFGTGADVQYTGSGNLIFSFDTMVHNFQFSLFDIDNSQRVNVTAVNDLGIPVPITMTKPAGGTVAITGSGSFNAQGLAPNTGQAPTSNLATLNLSIGGPVKTVTVALSGTAGDFWLSDLTACVNNAFPVDYFVASQPFTGQPTYVIGTSDTNTVSLINTASGRAKMIFQDPTSPRYINGIGYDHLEHNLYYVIDFTPTPSTNRTIKRYNFDTETMTVLVPDVNTLGIPTYNRGVESAGCAFYDNDLYFGVEGNLTPGNNSGRETIIWRIEFDAPGGNAIKACQVYATPSDNGSGISLHDWNDFTIADGILVDFAGSPNAAARRFTHYDLQTQTITNNYYTGGLTPRQAGITWNDTRYWVYDSIAVYNMAGGIGPRTRITGATVLDWRGFCGDATGFRPKSDFGDAPASYDPVALSPALHEKDTALHLGPLWDQEFNKTASALADADGSDEDAVATVPIMDTALFTYAVTLTVYNNTGDTANVVAWLDIDGNGTFEPSEGRFAIVPHGGPVLQTITLAWIDINTPLALGQITYLRIRTTRDQGGVTINSPTGYFDNGEVEDYPVYVDHILPVTILSFTATAANEGNQVAIAWQVENETNVLRYELQRSTNLQQWTGIGAVSAQNTGGLLSYSFTDTNPLKGNSMYRLRVISNNNQADKFSDIRTVFIKTGTMQVTVLPNPVKEQLRLRVDVRESGRAAIQIFDLAGKLLLQQNKDVLDGSNILQVADVSAWKSGMYLLVVKSGVQESSQTFSVIR